MRRTLPEIFCDSLYSRANLTDAKVWLYHCPTDPGTGPWRNRSRAAIRHLGREDVDDALACEFADQPHLNRSFRRVVGMSPGMWRRAHAEMLHAGPIAGLRV